MGFVNDHLDFANFFNQYPWSAALQETLAENEVANLLTLRCIRNTLDLIFESDSQEALLKKGL
jgi:hypothetical protein